MKKEDAPHPVAVFMYKNPHAPRPGRKVSAPKLGPQPKVPDEADWKARCATALASAQAARTAGTDPAAGHWRLDANGVVYGAGVAYGAHGLIDGALAFTDGEKSLKALREACRAAGILFCLHDNYMDIYPDCDGYSYDLTVFNLDGTPQRAWFNAWRHSRSYRWAPHAFHPWCIRNAKLLKAGCDPDAICIDVFTALSPFDYLDRAGRFHSKNETSANWGRGFQLYRQCCQRPDMVCVSEGGQDHLVGIADAGESDHIGAPQLIGRGRFADSERTPWHDIVTHGYYVLFAGGLGIRYQGGKGGNAHLHGYASDDYLSNCIIGGRNPMSDGPFTRNAVKTYWLQHAAPAFQSLFRRDRSHRVWRGGPRDSGRGRR